MKSNHQDGPWPLRVGINSLLLGVLVCSAATVAEGDVRELAVVRPHPEWSNALQPEGAPGPELTLASNGKADYVILVPAEPTSQEEKAAADLARWLQEMTGAKFPIINESASPPPPKAISIGQTTLLAQAGFSAPKNQTDQSDPTDQSDSLPPEAYAIHATADTLFLQGGDTRGIINAVYALLEEDLGCRWYHRDSATIPDHPNLTFRPVPRTFTPILEIRDPFYWDAFHVDWSLRNRTNAPTVAVPQEWGGRMYYASGYFVHTYNRLVPPAKYFEEHPEYYSMLNGKRVARQLCVTNPDVVRIATEQALEDLRKDPNGHLMSISPNDGTGYCECDTCKALDDAEGTRAASALQFVNAIADAIKDEFPRTKISTLAYLDTIKPPKTIRPRDNVVMRICTDRHAWSHDFEFLTETQECQTALKDWADIGAKIHIWDYTVNFSHYPIPMPNMPIVSQNIRFLINHNAKGIMLQGAYQSPGAARGPLRSWVWAKQLWDPSLNTRELMRDFTYGFYGEAAEPMQAYNELLWQLWEREHMGLLRGDAGNIRYPPTSAFLSKAFLDDASALFGQAVSLAVNPETLRRVKLAKLSILYVKVCQGPDRTDEDYAALLDEFETICRAEKVTHFYEGAPNFEEKMKGW